MAHLRTYAYEKHGVWNKDNYHYVSAIRVGDRIECSGQGGWDPNTGVILKDLNEQIDLAFANVDRCLKDAGGKGWSQVFRVNSYHIPLSDEAQEAMVRNFRKYMPVPHALWTCVEVTRLGGGPDMRIEIEVSAHDPEGAAEAASEASA
ncbi:Endoribonuclease L-PSP/chorismate mutase-like protein [Lipomyces kononenkoae]|uniref:Endoribonuclease L-PSP/chorismate mutase-like protein n=1 Tax=Lipomyces kononenkoae TaxID=34357 RepID=A0ACC3T3R5_LIPKO